ncbi:MAG: hypothetical protein QOG59_2445, partial [Solirubrobacteraceae bacterium]|nr:hypothetical protein [Solirubrobacteraceae bacterium]
MCHEPHSGAVSESPETLAAVCPG